MREQTRRLCLLVLAAALLGIAGCSRKSAAEEDEGSASVPQAAVTEVTVTQVRRGDISRVLSLSGSIAALPNDDVRFSALVAGRVAEVNVAEGDQVREGQLLAKIDDRPFRDQLRQVEAAEAQARANLENARLARARNETLVERGIAARKDLEAARTQEAVAEAGLRQAEAALSLASLQVSRCELRAPINGTVVKRFISVGEQVDGTAAQPIVEVAELRQVELFGNVPAANLGRLHPGQVLQLQSEEFPGQALSGRIVAISEAVDQASNTGLVRIRLSNAGRRLRLGQFLRATIPIETHRGALLVPPEAIYLDQQGRPHVYRVRGDTSTAVPVKVGIETPERVELLSGVSEGEAVILTGGYGLGETAKVRVKGPARP